MKKHHLRSALAAGTVIVMLVCTAAASARIVVDKSIDHVTLGTSMKSVRAVLGKPRYVNRCSILTVCSPVPGANAGTVSWSYGTPWSTGTSYVFINGRVALIGTFSRSERTPAGVGPGTSLKVAKQRYRHLAFHAFLPGEQPSGYYVTRVPQRTGDVYTLLVAAKGRVLAVEIGRWNTAPKFVCEFSVCS